MGENISISSLIALIIIMVGLAIYALGNLYIQLHNQEVESKYYYIEQISKMNCSELQNEKKIENEKWNNSERKAIVLKTIIEKGCLT